MASIADKLRAKRPEPKELSGLTRSSYSLVSCSDLTPGSLAVWLQLPDQIKYDSSLEPFRQFYEKEKGTSEEHEPLQRKPDNDEFNKIEVQPERIDAVSQFSHHEHDDDERKKTKTENVIHIVKLTSLIGIWIFFTVIFILYDEYKSEKRFTYVSPNIVKDIEISGKGFETIQLMLAGPFLSSVEEKEIFQNGVNGDLRILTVWLESKGEESSKWNVLLRNRSDLSTGLSRKSRLKLPAKNDTALLRMSTNNNESVPLTFEYYGQRFDSATALIGAVMLLVLLYGCICSEIINRSLAAVVVATLSIAVLALVDRRPTLEKLVSWLDFETLLLLFSMMVLVAILTETGLFDYVAVFVFSKTKGRTWPLITSLCLTTAVLSTFLDNVTTVLLMSPVTIRLCEVSHLNPVPILMAMVIFSNVGGSATPVGDPPNVIICSNREVIKAGINFTEFTIHMSIAIIFVSIQTYLQLRFIFRKPESLKHSAPPEIQELRGQIGVWKRAASRLATVSKDEVIVKNTLEKKVHKLRKRLKDKIREEKNIDITNDTFLTTLEELKTKYKIKDKLLLAYSLIAIIFVVIVFFLHSIPFFQRVSLGWTALLGAILLLILADREDLEPIFNRIEWSTLLFFAALFVLMEALSELGLIAWIGQQTERLILYVEPGSRLACAILLLVWVSGAVSAFLDNIPLTTMMIRVVTSLGTNPTVGLPMKPLIWALALGVCLGGNGTLIGASANVVTAGVAEQHGYKFTFMQFFKVGFPIMIGHLLVASGYLLLMHCVFHWH